MTNEAIIMNESFRLMEAGVLKTTGRELTLENGTKVPEPEPIHTFAMWKELGYSVKKGEKSSIKIPIWKANVKKTEVDGQEQEDLSMFMKVASFFTFAQVEKIAEA